MGGISADNLRLEAEAPAEVQRLRFLRDERVGARLQQKPVAALRPKDAAQTRPALDQAEVQGQAALVGQLGEAMGRRQAGDAASDDPNAMGSMGGVLSLHQEGRRTRRGRMSQQLCEG